MRKGAACASLTGFWLAAWPGLLLGGGRGTVAPPRPYPPTLLSPLPPPPFLSRSGHCKALKPVYEKVANAFKDESGVVVAALDADAHRDVGTK